MLFSAAVLIGGAEKLPAGSFGFSSESPEVSDCESDLSSAT